VAREILARAERFYRHVDSTVIHQRHAGGLPPDQTTLTATFGAGHDLFFAHVGHSRAYLFRNRELMRLTRDHVLDRRQSAPVGPLVDVNTTARDLRHILTDTIGMGGPIGPTIDLERIQLQDNDCVLVCTNGLTDAVAEPAIASLLASDRSPEEQAHKLVDLAVDSGTTDDVTALVARYRIPP
jgi:protein phosphatase